MAIQISGTTVINNTKDVVNTRHGDYVGIVTAASFVGDGSKLTNVNAGQTFFITARR